MAGGFGPEHLRRWAGELGIETFVGSSGRVFPREMKAAPLLRAWLHRLRAAGVTIHARHRWLGWDADGALRFATPSGESKVGAGDATVLALGGGSWARLGSDGAWVPLLRERGIGVAALRPANCGFDVAWSEHLRNRFAGTPVKSVAVGFVAPDGAGDKARRRVPGHPPRHRGQPDLRICRRPCATASRPPAAPCCRSTSRRGARRGGWLEDLSHPRGRDSLANHLRRRAGIDGVKAALLHEFATPEQLAGSETLAALIKALPIRLLAPRPLDEAISSAGGIEFGERSRPEPDAA
jgi:predicted flavoprotein YhiN